MNRIIMNLNQILMKITNNKIKAKMKKKNKMKIKMILVKIK